MIDISVNRLSCLYDISYVVNDSESKFISCDGKILSAFIGADQESV